jgi:hypothetical protein
MGEIVDMDCARQNEENTIQTLNYGFRNKDIKYSKISRRSNWPIAVAVRSGAWIVFARSNTEVVISNPTRGMDVCMRLFCACVILCVSSGLATGRSPVQGVLPTVYRIRITEKEAKAQQKVCRA